MESRNYLNNELPYTEEAFNIQGDINPANNIQIVIPNLITTPFEILPGINGVNIHVDIPRLIATADPTLAIEIGVLAPMFTPLVPLFQLGNAVEMIGEQNLLD